MYTDLHIKYNTIEFWKSLLSYKNSHLGFKIETLNASCTTLIQNTKSTGAQQAHTKSTTSGANLKTKYRATTAIKNDRSKYPQKKKKVKTTTKKNRRIYKQVNLEQQRAMSQANQNKSKSKQ